MELTVDVEVEIASTSPSTSLTRSPEWANQYHTWAQSISAFQHRIKEQEAALKKYSSMEQKVIQLECSLADEKRKEKAVMKHLQQIFQLRREKETLEKDNAALKDRVGVMEDAVQQSKDLRQDLEEKVEELAKSNELVEGYQNQVKILESKIEGFKGSSRVEIEPKTTSSPQDLQVTTENALPSTILNDTDPSPDLSKAESVAASSPLSSLPESPAPSPPLHPNPRANGDAGQTRSTYTGKMIILEKRKWDATLDELREAKDLLGKLQAIAAARHSGAGIHTPVSTMEGKESALGSRTNHVSEAWSIAIREEPDEVQRIKMQLAELRELKRRNIEQYRCIWTRAEYVPIKQEARDGEVGELGSDYITPSERSQAKKRVRVL
ncbi:uncharacterized protein I303_100275 [Kwoniella dejecticola CBS 10117]|uniref:Uncharacterized protein n=1 Tax=Kwoniella dejecticola CBS 10117 TaxID=1296121 RepID=A0A1A6AEI7_9TREE|nr:uncharacterized protein I303_00276 [Kwoniella dejecticola CBS 10117]OBR88459.1 hypothetical protein I303_00276 [Kwoniella dejecticola CBS 10117]